MTTSYVKQFVDLSHWDGEVNIQALKDLGHELVMIKASDGYYMPDINGKYVFDEEHHTDSRFVENVLKAHSAGMMWAPYHFCRWTNTQYNNFSIEERVQNQMKYLEMALDQLPWDVPMPNAVVLDMEEDPKMLAPLGVMTVSDMARRMVDLFLERFAHVIIYTGSWWMVPQINKASRAYIAARCSIWEAEYRNVGLQWDSNKNLLGIKPAEIYIPSVAEPWLAEYADTADDMIGKIFACQYTEHGGIAAHPGVSLDFNMTFMSTEELKKVFVYSDEPPIEPPIEPPVDPPDTIPTDSDLLLGIAHSLSNLHQKVDALFQVQGIVVDLLEVLLDGKETDPFEPPPAPPEVVPYPVVGTIIRDAPLFQDEDVIFESEHLRDWTDQYNLNSMRIVARTGNTVKIMYPAVTLDDDLYYKVTKDQKIDGIDLSKRFLSYDLYLPVKSVKVDL